MDQWEESRRPPYTGSYWTLRHISSGPLVSDGPHLIFQTFFERIGRSTSMLRKLLITAVVLAAFHRASAEGEPLLLVSELLGQAILQVDVTSGSTVTLPLGPVGQPLGLDYDPLTDYVYWSNLRDNDIKRARRDGSGREIIMDTGKDARGLALDHAGENIFWSVYDGKTISEAKTDGSSAMTLLTSPAIGRPYGIVLDPRNGLMYWVDQDNGRIDRAAMDGSGQTTIITGLSMPRPIAIDYYEDRLYYVDGLNRIFSSDLQGNDIREVLYEAGKMVNGIAVDENYVYWSSSWYDGGKIGKLSKSDLTKTVLVDGLNYPYGIYLSTAAPPIGTTACTADIVLVLDLSSSIPRTQFALARDFMLDFTACAAFKGHDIWVGVILYNCVPRTYFKLGQYTRNSPTMRGKIHYIMYEGGETRTGVAIRHMRDTSDFRDGVPGAAVILTDGQTSDDSAYEAGVARAAGINLYAVGVGSPAFVDQAALETITDDSDRVFDTTQACVVAQKIVDDLCGG
ncbi:LRP4 [Branchiostoma lanceolatum]|uniref:LRP4 protein n=1 Tax=Branchiostoma lanceolatum TaxID=7740 RepID=A0A8J9Z5G8_BRALA|nr:LRP4 [Branchiostoma lanceolatum]